VVPLEPTVPGQLLQTLDIYWQSSSYSGSSPSFSCYSENPAGSGNYFPPNIASNCGAGAFQVDLVPDTSNLTTDYTAYIYPSNTPPPPLPIPSFDISASNGQIQKGYCSQSQTPEWCQVSITFPAEAGYYLRVAPLYTGADFVVNGFDTTSTSVDFSNAQVLVDSTGQAGNVLQREQARFSLDSNVSSTQTQTLQLPVDGLDSGSGICKDYYFAAGDDTQTLTANSSLPCVNF
jgi:hypothetical protein